MNYLISKFPCFVDELQFDIQAGAKYRLEEIENRYYTFFVNNKPIYLNFCNKQNPNFTKVDHQGNSYYFLLFHDCANYSFQQIKCKGINIFLAFNSELILSIEGEEALRVVNFDFSYSHHKTIGDYIILFFDLK